MPRPECRKDLEGFGGMTQYLVKLLSDMSEVTVPLGVLLQKGVEWHWDKEKENTFCRLKEMVTNAPVLQYFGISKPVKISGEQARFYGGALGA
ncbi:hypothetical protein HOLleu_12857 [Holothuria leucospilota]|uniref:Uncharacterized protein n=1 Tax=Holothuria leucospilota TaxID=206669 RepID=A0A9Q1CAT7_HOLLE|nr:hypothetical protein HOLleu_12857 [Holothuria leucospilota]